MASGDFQGAWTYYSASLALIPDKLPARNNRAACLLKLSRWLEAEQDASLVLVVEPQNVKVCVFVSLSRVETSASFLPKPKSCFSSKQASAVFSLDFYASFVHFSHLAQHVLALSLTLAPGQALVRRAAAREALAESTPPPPPLSPGAKDRDPETDTQLSGLARTAYIDGARLSRTAYIDGARKDLCMVLARPSSLLRTALVPPPHGLLPLDPPAPSSLSGDV